MVGHGSKVGVIMNYGQTVEGYQQQCHKRHHWPFATVQRKHTAQRYAH